MPLSGDIRHQRHLVEQLRRSRIYRDYEKAFRETTGLPLSLRAADSFDLPNRSDPNENPLCTLMAGANHSCAGCLQLQKRLTDSVGVDPVTMRCFAGLSDSAVPVRVGKQLVAFLQTGQILLERPSAAGLRRLTRQLVAFGLETDLQQFEKAYLRTRVISRKHHESILRLLAIFAEHLAALSNQLVMTEAGSEMPAIARARAYICDHHDDELTLATVARAVNMSPFYFCKSFRKSTGLTFTDYVARVRVEKVKSLLLDPNKRVSEAAYEAGFQSLSQFNRVFRRISGQSPTVYREQLHPSSPLRLVPEPRSLAV
ncbi:MAG: helix-turn-helix domain-containing protein [Lacunisphaera sp.]